MFFDVVFCRFSMSLDVRLGWGWGGSISTRTWFDVMFLSCQVDVHLQTRFMLCFFHVNWMSGWGVMDKFLFWR